MANLVNEDSSPLLLRALAAFRNGAVREAHVVLKVMLAKGSCGEGDLEAASRLKLQVHDVMMNEGAEAKARLASGFTRCVLKGFSKSRYNGKSGTARAYSAAKGLYTIELDGFNANTGEWESVDARDKEQLEWTEDDAPLIAGDEWLSKPFATALEELFRRFDVDEDNLLSKEELKLYSIAANENNRCFTDVELQEIEDYFDWKDGGGQHKKGGLTLRGWYDMYHTQTCSEVEETWKDLRRLGYNGQLKRSGKS